MFERIIEFHGPKDFLDEEDIKPVPAFKNMPDWFKNLESELPPLYPYHVGMQTIKKCMPFLDSLKAGYILKNHHDIQINFNFKNHELNKQDINITTQMPSGIFLDRLDKQGANFTKYVDFHTTNQLGPGCPFVKQNSDLPFVKIVNTWIIKTPPGYSTLFLPIINNQDERFTPFAGIVDTDTGHYLNTNFPIICHKQGKWVLKRGTPLVSVFPFKRDKWKMKIKEIDTDKYFKQRSNHIMNFKEWYRKTFWTNKKWI